MTMHKITHYLLIVMKLKNIRPCAALVVQQNRNEML